MSMDTELTMANDMQTTNEINKTTIPSTGIGARLKTARVAMNLTEKDAAARLHLSVKFIDVMEKEDFNNGLPVTFMRGYMRSYARLLNVPESEIDAALHQLGMNITPTKLASPLLHTPSINNNERYVRWITYLISLVLVVLVGLWWSSHSRETANKNNTQPLVASPAISEVTTTTTATTNPTVGSPAPAANSVATTTPATATTPTPDNTAAQSTPDTIPTAPAQPAPPVAAVASQPNTPTKPAAAETDQTAQTVQTQSPADSTTTADKEETAPKSKQSHSAKATDEEEESPHMQMAVPEPGLDTSDY